MDRNTLLGLCATLNVATAGLVEAGHRDAARLVNAAVVEVHANANWDGEDLRRMGEAQAWLVAELGGSCGIRRFAL